MLRPRSQRTGRYSIWTLAKKWRLGCFNIPVEVWQERRMNASIPEDLIIIRSGQCCRKLFRRPGNTPHPDTSAGPPPRVRPLPPPHTRFATPAADAGGGFPALLPTDSRHAVALPHPRSVSNTNTLTRNTPPHTTSRSPRNSVTGNRPIPIPTSHTSNQLPGSNAFDNGSGSPATLTSDPYTGNTSEHAPGCLLGNQNANVSRDTTKVSLQ